MKSLQKSMADLKNVHPAQNGVGTLQPAVASVQGDVQQVAADAKNQFAPQVQQLETGFDAVKSAAATARTAPSAQTLGAVASAIRALGADVTSFANDIRPTC
jgi:ABC-type transporter Mla subunit MlaD